MPVPSPDPHGRGPNARHPATAADCLRPPRSASCLRRRAYCPRRRSSVPRRTSGLCRPSRSLAVIGIDADEHTSGAVQVHVAIVDHRRAPRPVVVAEHVLVVSGVFELPRAVPRCARSGKQAESYHHSDRTDRKRPSATRSDAVTGTKLPMPKYRRPVGPQSARMPFSDDLPLPLGPRKQGQSEPPLSDRPSRTVQDSRVVRAARRQAGPFTSVEPMQPATTVVMAKTNGPIRCCMG